MKRFALVGSLGALLVGASGCFGWGRAAAGPVTATTLEGDRVGGHLTADLALGSEDAPIAFDVFADGKVTERGGDGGLGMGALVFPFARPVTFFGRAGVHLFQVGMWNDKVTPEGKVSFGMFGPVAEAGLVITEAPGAIITLSTQVQLDVRFTNQPHEGFWGAALGFGGGIGSGWSERLKGKLR